MSDFDPSDRSEQDASDQEGPDATELTRMMERVKSGDLPPEEEVLRLLFGLKRQVSLSMSMSWDYPYPPPEAIDRYCERYPEAAAVIFSVFSDQAHHRMKMEDRKLAGDERRANSGIWIAAFIMVCLIVFAGFLAYLGHPGLSITAIILAIGAVGSIFYAVNRRQQRELAQKAKAVSQRTRLEKDDV